MLPFPTAAPYRIDQVTAAPLGMTALFLLMPTAAVVMSWAARRGRTGLWWWAAAGLVLVGVVFFTLGSWGNSDTTKLSHFLAFDLAAVRGEPFWQWVAPLVVRLPYRMALVHGLVAGGFAAAPILLARQWRAPVWAGWWALLLVCSPLLRGFLQNSHTRQALAALLLLPLMLAAGRLARLNGRATALLALAATTMHTTFPVTLLLSLLPRALVPRALVARAAGPRGPAPSPLGRVPLHRWLPAAILAFAGGALLLTLAGPTILRKLQDYSSPAGFFNSYALAPATDRLNLALLLGVLITCWQRRLGWRKLLADGVSRQLLFFGLLNLLLQRAIVMAWMPQISSRFADTVGFFLLIVWIAWLDRHGCRWASLPALIVTLDYWLLERLAASHTLSCGSDDAFLCIPDRWPWQVDYGSVP
jgi:hypothetical protein